MNTMEKIINDAKNAKPVFNPASIDIINNPSLNPAALEQILINFRSVPDAQLQGLIASKYSYILEQVVKHHKYTDLFSDVRGISIFTSVFSNMQYSYEDKVNVNKIVRSYKGFDKKDPEVERILLELASFINNSDIAALMFIDKMKLEFATDLAVARHSDMKETNNYKAVHMTICNGDVKYLTPEVIMSIYQALGTSRPISISTLWSVAMFNELLEEDGYSQSQSEIDSNEYYAIIHIVNQSPSSVIESAIRKINTEVLFYGTDSNKRYYRRRPTAVSSEFDRILSIADMMRANGEYIY